MSNVNIRRAIENIRSGTTIYSPVAEVIVNAIHAIQAVGDMATEKGKISVYVIRSGQLEIDEDKTAIDGFEISDNGIGFTDENRESFDTLYSDLKIKEGGKGFGRFICLKYFENLTVISDYKDGDAFKRRAFAMGKQNDIIVNERITPSDSKQTGATIKLSPVRSGTFPDKQLKTIATNLVEKLLPFFITKRFVCPGE